MHLVGSQDFLDVLAPDICDRHKYIPAIMLNAQGMTVSDPTTSAGSGAAMKDERTGEGRTYITIIIHIYLIFHYLNRKF